jgi:inosine-uridine nucleoside N-ribohydrolase
VRHTTENALRVLALAGRGDVPVAVGAAGPRRGSLHTAPDVHGESGLAGAALPDPVSEPVREDAVAFMAAAVAASDGPVTLVPVGPLTNVAAFVDAHPALLPRIERICLMGGAMAEGNTTPSAEFNIWSDPEAADVVFRAGVPITMMGLDVTHQAMIWQAEREALGRGGRVSRLVASLLAYFQRHHERVYGWLGTPLHDAVAVAHLVRPGLVTTAPYAVAIELQGALTRGRTVVDRWGITGVQPNADVGTGIDREAFRDLLFAAIRSYD